MSDLSHSHSRSNSSNDLPPLHPRGPSIAVDVDAPECQHGAATGDAASDADDSIPLSSAPASSLSLPLPSANFHRWMSCLACVTFDLTLGPSLEAVYPSNQLTPDEITNGPAITRLSTRRANSQRCSGRPRVGDACRMLPMLMS